MTSGPKHVDYYEDEHLMQFLRSGTHTPGLSTKKLHHVQGRVTKLSLVNDVIYYHENDHKVLEVPPPNDRLAKIKIHLQAA